MDLFAVDHVAPFPDSGELPFAAGLLSNHPNPQKLRPIRSLPPPPSGYVFHSHSSPKPDPPKPSVKPQDPNGSGSGFSPVLPQQEPGSSLDDEDGVVDDAKNSSESSKEFGSRKKTKKTGRKVEHFLETLVKAVMEKQEQMHLELMEMIGMKERERLRREEAWRREEMERIKKDEKDRAKERDRSLAVIMLIQKHLGHENQIPQPVEGSGKREEEEVEANNKGDINGDLCNNRWPDVEVQALITIRTALDQRYGLIGSKGSIWEETSGSLRSMGYNRSAKKCKEKWENINKYYRRTVANSKKRAINSKMRPYFDELDNLYKNVSFNSLGNALINSNNVSMDEEKVQSEI